MEVIPSGGALGAEIRGVDVRAPKDDEVARIREALLENEVVFFRDTGLDDEGHLALAARFGKPSVFPLFAVLGETEPTFQTIADGPDSPPATDYWHTDVTWTAAPPTAAFLRATVVPDRGGDTMWGSMTAAYEALSDRMRAFCEGLHVRHDNASFIRGLETKLGADAVAEWAAKLREAHPPVEHPLVRTHPETGRRALLWGGGFMREVVELEKDESDALLAFLGRHIDQPIFHARWRWGVGDLAIWDERSTVHRGLSDHFPRPREVRRCVIDGDRPV
ncbi:MAG: TauD/TfdA family dioxygenase [Myxococcota bacterium]